MSVLLYSQDCVKRLDFLDISVSINAMQKRFFHLFKTLGSSHQYMWEHMLEPVQDKLCRFSSVRNLDLISATQDQVWTT